MGVTGLAGRAVFLFVPECRPAFYKTVLFFAAARRKNTTHKKGNDIFYVSCACSGSTFSRGLRLGHGTVLGRQLITATQVYSSSKKGFFPLGETRPFCAFCVFCGLRRRRILSRKRLVFPRRKPILVGNMVFLKNTEVVDCKKMFAVAALCYFRTCMVVSTACPAASSMTWIFQVPGASLKAGAMVTVSLPSFAA